MFKVDIENMLKVDIKTDNGLAVFKANNKDIKIKPTESRSGTFVDNFEQTQDINYCFYSLEFEHEISS